jgi:hypothetical protein
VVSTYAIHHLVADEKRALLAAVFARMRSGGRLAIGDLMVPARASIADVRRELAHPDVEQLFADEFPWFVDEALADFERMGFEHVDAQQTGALSWGLAARRPA